MKISRRQFKTASGQLMETNRFYIDFHDHRGKRRRLCGHPNEKVTEIFAGYIKDLVDYRKANIPLDARLQGWLRGCNPEFLEKFIEWDMIGDEYRDRITSIRMGAGRLKIISAIISGRFQKMGVHASMCKRSKIGLPCCLLPSVNSPHFKTSMKMPLKTRLIKCERMEN